MTKLECLQIENEFLILFRKLSEVDKGRILSRMDFYIKENTKYTNISKNIMVTHSKNKNQHLDKTTPMGV